jgi:hypothetical protein
MYSLKTSIVKVCTIHVITSSEVQVQGLLSMSKTQTILLYKSMLPTLISPVRVEWSASIACLLVLLWV